MGRTGPITRDASTVQLGLSQIRIGKSAPYIGMTDPVLTAQDSLGAMASTGFTSETEFWDLESGFPLGLDATFPLRESNMIECAFKEITPKTLAISRGMDPFSDIAAAVTVLDIQSASGGYVEDVITADNSGSVTDIFNVIFTSPTAFEVRGQKSGLIGTGSVDTEFAPDNGGNPYFTIPANTFTGTWAANDSFTMATAEFVAGTSAFSNAHAGSIPLGSLAAPKYLRVEAVYTFPNPQYGMVIIFPRANVTSSLSLDQQPEDAAAVTLSIKSMGASDDVVGGNSVWNNMANGQILFTGG